MSRAVTRRPEAITVDHLAAIDGPCRDCAFWELDPVRRARLDPGDVAAEKQSWLSTVLREWGSCGQVLLDPTGTVIGYAVHAPAAFVPGAGGFSTAPVSGDAVLLAALWVRRDHAGSGLGRILVQAVVRDLVRRGGVRALEAFGDARGPGPQRTGRLASRPPGPGERCVIPVDFLGRVGFGTQRPHPSYPRMRMELRSVLTWRDEVEAALEKLRGVVRPETAPSPAPRAHRARRGVPGTDLPG